jgi:hypothetical protein
MTYILPVGIPGGLNSGLGGLPTGTGMIRRGGEFIALEQRSYLLWRAAAATPEAAQLARWATESGIDQLETRIGSLLESELCVEHTATSTDVGRLAALLIGECLGNGPQPSPRFVVRGATGRRIDVDARVFEVLLRSDGMSDLGQLCATVDGQRTDVTLPPTLEAFASGLALMVSSGVVRLDGVSR